MASVSNLDQDVKRDRESQVTKSSVQEVSVFVEEALKEPLRASNRGELQKALKDGVVLCRYDTNLVPSFHGHSAYIRIKACRPCVSG